MRFSQWIRYPHGPMGVALGYESSSYKNLNAPSFTMKYGTQLCLCFYERIRDCYAHPLQVETCDGLRLIVGYANGYFGNYYPEIVTMSIVSGDKPPLPHRTCISGEVTKRVQSACATERPIVRIFFQSRPGLLDLAKALPRREQVRSVPLSLF